jgi:YVTN family beta-propeller protein/VCBS repeat-containing protein
VVTTPRVVFVQPPFLRSRDATPHFIAPVTRDLERRWGNARYVGRVGALAVALGVGAAMGGLPCVALAEPDSTSSQADSSDQSPASSDTTSTTLAGTTAGTAFVATDSVPTASTDPSTSTMTTGTSTSTSTSTSTTSSTSIAASTSLGSTATDDPRAGIVQSTGGAQTSGSSTSSGAQTIDSGTSSLVVGPDRVAHSGTRPAIAPRSAPTRGTTSQSTASSLSGSSALKSQSPTPLQFTVQNLVSAIPTTLASASFTTVPGLQPGQRSFLSTTVGPHISLLQQQPVAVGFSGLLAPLNIVAAAASNALAFVGLGSLAGTDPPAPVESPLLWPLLAWVRREYGQTLSGETPERKYGATLTSPTVEESTATIQSFTAFAPTAAVNTAPTASPTQTAPNPITGAVTGFINGSDVDGNALTYALTGGAPTSGTVTVNASTGAFTYTPTQAARLAAGVTTTVDLDSFTVSVSDGQAATAVAISVPVLPAVFSGPTTTMVGTSPLGVAVSPTKTYVANSASNTVSVIDRSTSSVATIAVVNTPMAIALSPDGSRAYVAGNNAVSVIDTATNAIVRTVATNGGQCNGIAVSPNGQQVYVTNTANNTVSVIKVNTGVPKVIATIKVGSTPAGVAVSPDGKRVYVANWSSNSVSVIATATYAVVATIAVGPNPFGVAVSPDSSRAYVSNFGSNNVSVISTVGTPAVVSTVAVGAQPYGISISPDGSLLYAANGNDTVSVINTKTNTVVRTVTVDSAPKTNTHGIAVSPDGRQIYVADKSDSAVRVLSINRGNTAPVGGTPTVGTPDASTGAVTGALNFTDPDGDALTYNVPTQPVSGTVTVNAPGTFSYTPTQTARDAAAQTLGPDWTSFTVVASDGLASSSVIVTVPIAPTITTPPIFTGDYGTGDFSQWGVQNRFYAGPGTGYTPTYSASIVNDATYGTAARFEVRSGDVPYFGGGERSEVYAGTDTGGTEGQIRWYEFSTKFDPSFPMNHADLGWGLVNQWHADDLVSTPSIGWYVDKRNGYWSLTINKQASPNVYLDTRSIFDAPLNPGVWQDVKMQVYWSTSDSKGWVRLWMNGVRQTFVNGSDTYYVRTMVPGTTTVYYKEGYYRQPMAPTGVVFHAGFRCASDEAGLYSAAPAADGTATAMTTTTATTGTHKASGGHRGNMTIRSDWWLWP